MTDRLRANSKNGIVLEIEFDVQSAVIQLLIYIRK